MLQFNWDHSYYDVASKTRVNFNTGTGLIRDWKKRFKGIEALYFCRNFTVLGDGADFDSVIDSNWHFRDQKTHYILHLLKMFGISQARVK